MEVNRIGNAAQKVKDGAVDFGNYALDKGGALKDAAMHHGRKVIDQSTVALKKYHADGESFIKTNPYSSVLYALGVGALLGGALVGALNIIVMGKNDE